MPDRPAPIALDDLARPRFSPEAREILDLMEAAASTVTLEAGALMTAATQQAGLDDFGGNDFVARLEVLCRSLRDEARLNGAGRLAQSVLLAGLLRNRLLLEDLWARHPEIGDVEIERPIFICGLPRTGTTHLHNLLSSDSALRSLPYWESVEPVLSESERPTPGAPDPRLARTEMSLSFLDVAMPEFKRMHEMTVDHVHEEIQLLAIDFSTMLFETIAPIPTWRDHYLARDQTPSYAYLKRILQAMQWARGGSRWILKSPQHLEQFGVVADVFPDATFVVTHRDPVSVTASMITMIAYSARLGHEEVDLGWIGSYWADRLERMLRSCVEHRDLLPDVRTIDVRFDEFMADDLAMVRRIYALAGQPMSDAADAAMRQFMHAHPRGRHGGVIYDLAEFGLSADELRHRFAFYSDHFGIAARNLRPVERDPVRPRPRGAVTRSVCGMRHNEIRRRTGAHASRSVSAVTSTEVEQAAANGAVVPRATVIIETSTNEEYEHRGAAVHDGTSVVRRVLEEAATVPLEILIMTNTDDVDAWMPMTRDNRVRVIAVTDPGYYAMKTAGAQAATTEYVIFLDGDCVPRPGWAKAAVAALDAGADAVAGKTRYIDKSPWGRAMSYFDMGNVSEAADGRATSLVLNNVAFRRDQYLANPIDNRLRRSGGCFLLNCQLRVACQRIVYEPKMFVEHGNDYSENYCLAKRIRNGHDTATLYRVDELGVVPHQWLQRIGPLGAPLVVGRRLLDDAFLLARTHSDFNIPAVGAPVVWLLAIPLRLVEGVAYAISSVKPSIIGRRWG